MKASQSMLNAVIFDLDGTLVDTNYLHVEAFARAFLEIENPVPRATLHRQIGKGAMKFLPGLVGGDRELAERIDARHRELYAEMQRFGQPLPGAKELICSLSERRYQVWLGTSARPDELRHHISTLEAEARLAGVVSAEDVEEPKPEPDIFQAALQRCGVPPDEAVVVGDTVWDVEAANKIGVRCVAVLTGGAFSRAELMEAGAVTVYQDCAELLANRFPEGF